MAEAVSRMLPTAAARGQVMWDLWWTKWHWGRFSPAISHSTSRSTIIYHLGLEQ
jgi:hypothetical protein